MRFAQELSMSVVILINTYDSSDVFFMIVDVNVTRIKIVVNSFACH